MLRTDYLLRFLAYNKVESMKTPNKSDFTENIRKCPEFQKTYRLLQLFILSNNIDIRSLSNNLITVKQIHRM